jgi:hypothetical protein
MDDELTQEDKNATMQTLYGFGSSFSRENLLWQISRSPEGFGDEASPLPVRANVVRRTTPPQAAKSRRQTTPLTQLV